MKLPRFDSLKRATIALGLGLGALGCAHAGKIGGSWDPNFGGTILPDLSWSGQAQFNVLDTCSAQADGVYSATGPCAGTTVDFAMVTFSDDTATLDPQTTQTIDFATFGLSATSVKVYHNQVIAVATNGAGFGIPSLVLAAHGNYFALQFTSTSPILVCIACTPTGPDFLTPAPNVSSSLAGMTQTFVTYFDDGTPKLVDAFGNPVGVNLDSGGNVIGFTSPPVPEPEAWAMMLGGLMAVGLLRRLRR